jgi:cytochrome c oxidase cbb3-type subunit 3
VNEFTSEFWSAYIAILTIVSILACGVLLWKLSTKRLAAGQKAGVMGHVWDENLEEYNNPLPRWWMWLFWITLVFAVVYLALYPGLGSFAGVLKWSSTGQYDREQARAAERFEPKFAQYAAMDIPAVAADPKAHEMGQRMFLNYCAQCHASDARGRSGFPNLADNDWLYGGTPEAIVATITNGRGGVMPPWPQLGSDGTRNVTHYVLQMAGRTHDELKAAQGRELFATNCAACHGADGKGNPALGAPNLTDDVWLYGGGETTIMESITKGRNGQMPAWGEFLGPNKTHLLAAYVYGLSKPAGQ